MSRLIALAMALLITSTAWAQPVTITLTNPTATSIPLIIPSVMNPNLSPFSRSGVIAQVGQEVYYRRNGKRTLLLTVTADLDGQDVNIAERIKAQAQAQAAAKREAKRKR